MYDEDKWESEREKIWALQVAFGFVQKQSFLKRIPKFFLRKKAFLNNTTQECVEQNCNLDDISVVFIELISYN